MHSSHFRLAVVVILLITLCSCGFTPDRKLVSLTAEPVSVIRGQSQQIVVTAHYSDGSTAIVSGVIFGSTSDGIVTVSPSGMVTGVTVGTSTIGFSFQGMMGNVRVAVERHLISVTLANGSLPRGQSLGLTLIGNYDDNTTTAMTDVTWNTSNPTVATISGGGVITGMFAGTVTISASAAGMQTTGTWQITAPASGAVGTGGGTISSAGTSIPGVIIEIPAGALPANATIAIDTDPVAPSALDPSLTQIGSTWILEKDLVYNFYEPVTVTIPIDVSQLTSDDLPLVYYWNPTYSQYIAATVTSFDPAAGTVTFQTAHFSKYVPVAVRGIWSSGQATSIATKFRPDVDGFFHPNFGSYATSGGSSFGMSLYAMWYFTNKAQADGTTLYNKYREGDPAKWQDDATAHELISRLYVATSSNWAKLSSSNSGENLDSMGTVKQIWSAMQSTGQPQLLLLRGKTWTQAVVVYAWDASHGQFSVYDPNFPGEAVTLAYTTSGGFGAYSKAAAYSDAIQKVVFRSLSDAVSGEEFEELYQAAENGFATGAPTVTITAPALDSNNIAILSDGSQGVTIQGKVSGGSPAPTHAVIILNGSKHGQAPLAADGSFSYPVPGPLPGTTNVKVVGTSDPLDPWANNTGFAEAIVKVQGHAFVTNAGFETGDWTGWSHWTFTWFNPVHYFPEKSGLVKALDGFDPIDTSLPQVYTGTWAARVNNYDNNLHISTVEQTVTVPSVSNPEVRFYWAAVLEDPQHPPSDQPYVDVQVVDLDSIDPNTSQPTVLYYKHFYSNDPTYSGWKVFGGWKVIEWQPVVLSLGNYVGHQVRISVTAADCAQSGHGGYAYLDGDEQ